MNWTIIIFFSLLLTARFFSERIGLIPKWADQIDLAVIPLLALAALGMNHMADVDRNLHQRITKYIGAFVAITIISALANVTRIITPAAVLFLFGMLEGPLLYLILNRSVRDKDKFGDQMAKFLGILFLVQGGVVIFINFPDFLLMGGNPDAISGTFGTNAYQFSALLIVMGGFFLGKFKVGTYSKVIGIAVQVLILITFLFLQYRAATPAFLFSYLVLLTVLYGKRVVRLAGMVAVMAAIAAGLFSFIGSTEYRLKFEDLLTLASNPGMLMESGKVISIANTFSMYSDIPTTMVLGAGPGTYVSRAAYTFCVEAMDSRELGIGKIVRDLFGRKEYRTDVFIKYVEPLYDLPTMFGSVQANNPNSGPVALMAELGIPGLVIMVLLYTLVMKRSIGYVKFAVARADPLLVPLASALLIGMVYFLSITPLDNYLEMARVTLPIWLLFWTVSSLVRKRRVEEVTSLIEAQQQLAISRQLQPALT